MKASEMTNEDLARELMSRVPLDSTSHDDLREAAVRLRKQCDCKNCEIARSEMRFRKERSAFETKCREDYKKQGEVMAETAKQNVELQRRLKVAEDALDSAWMYADKLPHQWPLPKMVRDRMKNALAAIRNGKVEKARAALEKAAGESEAKK